MVRVIRSVILLHFLVFTLAALERDDIVFYPGELSPAEEAMIADGKDGSFDQIPLYKAYCIASEITREEQLSPLMSAYDMAAEQVESKVKGISDKYLQSRDICRYMHKYLLKSYSFDAIWPDELVSDGIYNCVSSAAVYADLLKRRGLKAEFAQVTRHTFCYALTGSKKVQVETTNPAGFDPGKTVITNPDGSWSSSTPQNYSRVNIQNEAQFIASRYYDKRLMRRSSDPAVKHRTFKISLYLNPEDKAARDNLVYYTRRYLDDLYKKGSSTEAEKILLDTLNLLRATPREAQGLMPVFSTLLTGFILKGDSESEQRLFARSSEILGKAAAAPLIEFAYMKAAETVRIKLGPTAATPVYERGLKHLPGSQKLKTSRQSMELLAAMKVEDPEQIALKYEKLLAESPGDARIIQNYLYVMSPILLNYIKNGRYDEADSYIRRIGEKTGQEHVLTILNQSYGNALYQFIKSGYCQSCTAAGRRGLALGETRQLVENYIAGLQCYAREISEEHGLNALVELLAEEAAVYTNIPRITSSFPAILGQPLAAALSRADTNTALRAIAFTERTAGKNARDSLISTAFVNSIYNLYSARQYEKAMIVGELGLSLSSNPKLQNNYAQAVKEYCEERLMARDSVGTMALIRESIRKHPEIKRLYQLPAVIYREHLTELLVTGDIAKSEKVFSELAAVMPEDEYKRLKEGIYTSATHQLYQQRRYHESVYTAEIFLEKSSSQKVYMNFRAALQKKAAAMTVCDNADSIIKIYSRYFKLYPQRKELKGDMKNAVSMACLDCLKADRDISGVLNSIKTAAGADTANQTAEFTYVKQTYLLIQQGKYLEAMKYGEDGFKWRKSTQLRQNYSSAAGRQINKLLRENRKSEARKVLARARKQLPEDTSLRSLEQRVK